MIGSLVVCFVTLGFLDLFTVGFVTLGVSVIIGLSAGVTKCNLSLTLPYSEVDLKLLGS